MITFTIPGTPIGKPRMTQRDVWKRRPCVVRYREWCDRAREEVRKQVGELPPPDRVLSLSWVAWIGMPKSWSGKKRAMMAGELHRSRPDRDNIDKAILDCLYQEDSAIASGTIEKRWGRAPRLEVTIKLVQAAAA